MEKQAAAVRLVTAVDEAEADEKKRVKHICLCGKTTPHASDDCMIAHPGTPWWNALYDAEEGEEVEVRLPSRTVRLLVTAIEIESDAVAA